ncbi:MAG: hypothetical protein V2A74_14595 [bacterium]
MPAFSLGQSIGVIFGSTAVVAGIAIAVVKGRAFLKSCPHREERNLVLNLVLATVTEIIFFLALPAVLISIRALPPWTSFGGFLIVQALFWPYYVWTRKRLEEERMLRESRDDRPRQGT